MTAGFHPCVVIPTYDNPETIDPVVRALRDYLPDVYVVDDGSHEEARAALADLANAGLARVRRHPYNRGKGAALRAGLAWAWAAGHSHALQVDGDGQHDIGDVPRFLETAQRHGEAVILGQPVFDGTAPRGRRVARLISKFWVDVETGGPVIADPLCGFRVYPLAKTVGLPTSTERMGFDPEIAVRLSWAGTPVINLPTRVRYLSRKEGGVSHYRLFWDNLEMSYVHARLCNEGLVRITTRWLTGRSR
jgi:glycosyltransferase involved in cell wall biosynthesis